MKALLIGDVGGVDGYHAGDEAMLDVAVDQLRNRGSTAITVVSGDPDDTSARYGVDAVARVGFAGRDVYSDESRDRQLAAVLAIADGTDDGAFDAFDPQAAAAAHTCPCGRGERRGPGRRRREPLLVVARSAVRARRGAAPGAAVRGARGRERTDDRPRSPSRARRPARPRARRCVARRTPRADVVRARGRDPAAHLAPVSPARRRDVSSRGAARADQGQRRVRRRLRRAHGESSRYRARGRGASRRDDRPRSRRLRADRPHDRVPAACRRAGGTGRFRRSRGSRSRCASASASAPSS